MSSPGMRGRIGIPTGRVSSDGLGPPFNSSQSGRDRQSTNRSSPDIETPGASRRGTIDTRPALRLAEL
jgi:hypothetical protein